MTKWIILFLLFSFFHHSSAQGSEAIQAVLITKILKYTDWNGKEKHTYRIGYYGESPVVSYLEHILKRTGQPFRLIKLSKKQLRTKRYDLILISKKIPTSTRFHTETLVISLNEDYQSEGTILSFTEVDGRVQFIVYKQALSNSSIYISSRLLKLAFKVVEEDK